MLKHLTTGRDQRDCECVCVKERKREIAISARMFRQKET